MHAHQRIARAGLDLGQILLLQHIPQRDQPRQILGRIAQAQAEADPIRLHQPRPHRFDGLEGLQVAGHAQQVVQRGHPFHRQQQILSAGQGSVQRVFAGQATGQPGEGPADERGPAAGLILPVDAAAGETQLPAAAPALLPIAGQGAEQQGVGTIAGSHGGDRPVIAIAHPPRPDHAAVFQVVQGQQHRQATGFRQAVDLGRKPRRGVVGHQAQATALLQREQQQAAGPLAAPQAQALFAQQALQGLVVETHPQRKLLAVSVAIAGEIAVLLDETGGALQRSLEAGLLQHGVIAGDLDQHPLHGFAEDLQALGRALILHRQLHRIEIVHAHRQGALGEQQQQQGQQRPQPGQQGGIGSAHRRVKPGNNFQAV